MGSRRGRIARAAAAVLLGLAALAAAARLALCRVLRVPTASMEPALHGDATEGDELLVFEPWFSMFEPRRFDLVVFERRGDGVRSGESISVKRVAALGGESVRIEGGDLFVAPKGGAERRLSKSYAEFLPLLVPLWRMPVGADGLPLGAGAGAPSVLALVPDDPDEVLDDGWLDERGQRHAGRTPVNDVLFRFEVEATRQAHVAFAFSIGVDRNFLDVDPLDPGRRHVVEFWHVDGRAGSAVDGVVQRDAEIAREGGDLVVGSLVRDAVLEVDRGAVTLRRIEILRDLHFTEPEDAAFAVRGPPFVVGEDELFVLGDASFQSVDSRHFGAVRRADLAGAPLLVVGPPGRRRRL